MFSTSFYSFQKFQKAMFVYLQAMKRGRYWIGEMTSSNSLNVVKSRSFLFIDVVLTAGVFNDFDVWIVNSDEYFMTI